MKRHLYEEFTFGDEERCVSISRVNGDWLHVSITMPPDEPEKPYTRPSMRMKPEDVVETIRLLTEAREFIKSQS